MPHVFTYGTLEIPEVMDAVTNRSFRSVQATAHGFARFLIKTRIYPGIMPEPTAQTSGRLYLDVDSRTLHVLDRFEDPVYSRQSIGVETMRGEKVEAFAYIISSDNRDMLSSNPWDQEFFIAHHLPEYLQRCQGFSATIICL